MEIIGNAISSSTRDPRFPPMKKEELENVVFSVDVLGEPEKVNDLTELDPKKWGVVVSKGSRRGVLLPDLEGVNTVEEQIEIASRKAGISEPDGISVERFGVDRYPEL
jgi:AMMECR1 domain-containing protein